MPAAWARCTAPATAGSDGTSRPSDSRDDAERLRRFRREARSAAALNHPNICVVHEFGHDDGTDFIVMELVEGRPLSDIIPRSGLPSTEVIRLGIQIAAALSHAHERAVVHETSRAATCSSPARASGPTSIDAIC